MVNQVQNARLSRTRKRVYQNDPPIKQKDPPGKPVLCVIKRCPLARGDFELWLHDDLTELWHWLAAGNMGASIRLACDRTLQKERHWNSADFCNWLATRMASGLPWLEGQARSATEGTRTEEARENGDGKSVIGHKQPPWMDRLR
ncbi:hypothetical protein [Boseongicola sp. H5]|uniref:hypothetical protein n=1 Tax=Boseongicola sp. H5 TaxID=2763261 RepID=UPI001D0BA4E1|nr:hypothetical protein [Boseongicola sp. H5]